MLELSAKAFFKRYTVSAPGIYSVDPDCSYCQGRGVRKIGLDSVRCYCVVDGCKQAKDFYIRARYRFKNILIGDQTPPTIPRISLSEFEKALALEMIVEYVDRQEKIVEELLDKSVIAVNVQAHMAEELRQELIEKRQQKSKPKVYKKSIQGGPTLWELKRRNK